METLLSPLQLDATSGVGKTLIVPEPERIVRFLIRTKGAPTGGEITIECCPMKAPGISEGGANDRVRPSRSTVATQPQLHPALLILSAMTSPVLHCDPVVRKFIALSFSVVKSG
jgi:hypothetical protein